MISMDNGSRSERSDRDTILRLASRRGEESGEGGVSRLRSRSRRTPVEALEYRGRDRVENQRYRERGREVESRDRVAKSAEPDRPSFHERYNDVVKANAGAERKSKQMSEDRVHAADSRSRDDKKLAGTESATEDSVCSVDADRTESVDDPSAKRKVSDEEQTREAAWILIRQSLEVVSQTLNLNIMGDIEDIGKDGAFLSGNSDAVLDQFAEILGVLKSLAGLLENASSENIALEIPGGTIEPEQAKELKGMLQTQAFRLELAFSMLHVSQEVSTRWTGTQQQPLPTDIPTALDPESIVVQSDRMREIFGGLLSDGEDRIRSILEKMAGLAEQPRADTTNGLLVASNPQETTLQGIKDFSTSLFRQMLKIDEVPADSQNEPAPQKALFGGESPLSPAKTTGAVPLQQQVLQILNPDAESRPVSGIDTAVDASGRIIQVSPSDTGPLKNVLGGFRDLEENVMRQLTSKVHTAIKSGFQEVRLHLHPQSLGEVHLKLRVEGDIVVAKLAVESLQVKQIVEANSQSLRDALAQHGLTMQDLDVGVNQEGDYQSETETDRQTARSGKGGGDESDSSVEDVDAAMMHAPRGTETGRRFGDNTVEYFI